jgi:hypothetical protein
VSEGFIRFEKDITIFHNILEIFNEFFSTGNTPEDWRETKVVSILKPGKKPGIADYCA